LQSDNPNNSTEEHFAGSDAYCEAVTTLHGTTAEFSGGPLRCQHTGMMKTQINQNIQQDVCLPESPDLLLESSGSSTPAETCADVCGASQCLRISYSRRTWTMRSFTFDDARMITKESEGNDPDRYLLTAFYCLD
jgi:hypothetical protein